MTKLHSDQVKERIARIMDGITDDVTWDYVINMISAPPTPENPRGGDLIVIAVLLIFMKNPLLGQPEMIHCGIIPDFQIVHNDELLRDTILQALTGLREQRAVLLGQQSVPITNGSLIVPR